MQSIDGLHFSDPGTPMNRTILLATAAVAAVVPFSANAQTTTRQHDMSQGAAVSDSNATAGGAEASAITDASATAEGPTPGSAKQAHPDPDQAIVVTGVRRAAGDVLGGVSVVDKEELTHDMKPSLGDTLSD